MAVTARLEIRIRPESKERLEHAAALRHAPVSEFVRSAIEEQVERVLAEHESHTQVPAEFFDDLLIALDSPAVPSDALARAAARTRDAVVRA